MPQNFDWLPDKPQNSLDWLPDKSQDNFDWLPDKPKQKSWYEDFLTVPNLIRFGGSAVGSGLGALAATTGAGAAVTYPLIFGGGALGEAGARWWEGKDFDPAITALEGGLNLLPGTAAIPGRGAGLKQIAKYGAAQAGHGLWQGVAGTFPRHQAEKGNLLTPSEWEMPGAGEFISQGAGGAVVGGAVGLGMGAHNARFGKLKAIGEVPPIKDGENIDLNVPPPAAPKPPPPAVGGPPASKIFAKGNKWDQPTMAYWGSRGYVPGGIDPDGRIFWVPGKEGVKAPPPVIPDAPTGVQDAGGIRFHEDEGFTVPAEQMSPEVETNLEKDGFKKVGEDLKGGSIFKRFITDEEGIFDPEALWQNLKRLLGRDPTDAELIEGMQRQGEEGDQAKTFTGTPDEFLDMLDQGAPPGSLIPPETLAKIPPDVPPPPRLRGDPPSHQEIVDSLYQRARELGIDPDGYRSLGELEDAVQRGEGDIFNRGDAYDEAHTDLEADMFGPRPEIPPQDKWDQPQQMLHSEAEAMQHANDVFNEIDTILNKTQGIVDMARARTLFDELHNRLNKDGFANVSDTALKYWNKLMFERTGGGAPDQFAHLAGDPDAYDAAHRPDVPSVPTSPVDPPSLDNGVLQEAINYLQQVTDENTALGMRADLDKAIEHLRKSGNLKELRLNEELMTALDKRIDELYKEATIRQESANQPMPRSIDEISDDLEEALNYGNGANIPDLIAELKSKIASEFDIQRALSNRGMMGALAENLEDPAHKIIFEDLHQAADNQYYQLVRDSQAGQPPVDPNQVYPPQTPMERGWNSGANEIWQKAIDLGINPDDYLLSDLYEAVRLREGGGPSPEQIYMELRRQWENVRQSPDSPEKQQLRRQLDAAYQDWKNPKRNEDTAPSSLPPGHVDVGDTRFINLNEAIQSSPSTSEIVRRQIEIEQRYQRDGRAIDKYRLPDGRIIPVDATATKGEQISTFQGKDGKVVKMEYVGPLTPQDTIDPNTGNVIQLRHPDDPDFANDIGGPPTGPEADELNRLAELSLTGELTPAEKNRFRELQSKLFPDITQDPFEDVPNPFASESGLDISQMRQQNTLGAGIPGEQMAGPRGIADISIDQPMPPMMGQQEMPLGPHGELTPREGLPEDMIAGLQSPERPIVPEGTQPEQMNIPLPDENLPPVSGGVKAKEKEPSLLREAFDFSRGVTTILDLSASLRQGLPFAFNKNWRAAWKKQWASLGSEGAYQKSLADIKSRELFQSYFDFKTKKVVKSIAGEAGLGLMDVSGKKLTGREEGMAGKWIGKIPGARASNRAYTAFLNQLRADTFESLFKDAEALFKAGAAGAKDPRTDKLFAKEIADFVNTATGRGPLKTALPYHTTEKGWHLAEYSLERNVKLLTDVLFAPRLIASRMRMMNPLTYSMASPFVRKQYYKAALTTAASWMTVATVAKMGGAEVSTDPLSSDFGKIKIGNVRIDPGGGFQQFLVAFARLVAGRETPSTGGKQIELGQGFRADTRWDVTERLMVNKMHPVIKFGHDILDASERIPFNMMDRTAQLFVPLIVQDTIELIKEGDPRLLLLLGPVALGMGTQTYDKGETRSKIIPKSVDFSFEGGSPY